MIEVTTHLFKLPRLSEEFDGYRIAQISDFHLGEWQNEKYLPLAIDQVRQNTPDVIVITGDIVAGAPNKYKPLLEKYLPDLRAKDGVIAVLGNHDHANQPDIVGTLLQRHGIHVLSNDYMTIQRGGSKVNIAGVDSLCWKKNRFNAVLAQLPHDGAAILLAHEPDFADESAASGRFDLQLSGHSHGGQIRLPRIGSLFYPKYSRKYPLGRYQINGMIHYTNRGVGMAHLPFRWNCPAEVSIFILKSSKP